MGLSLRPRRQRPARKLAIPSRNLYGLHPGAFSLGRPLSGVKDEADIAWYGKTVTVPDAWKDKRTFLTIGASDWLTTVWIDGRLLGSHQGGYTPFSFELTPYLTYGKSQQIVIRVDDKRRSFTLYGKQGYGNARGSGKPSTWKPGEPPIWMPCILRRISITDR